MRDITKEELKVILENHKHWVNEDIEGWESMRADLSGANLCHADLSGADLRYADLSDANLECANLSNALLRGAILRNANLSNALLRGANIVAANLEYADLKGVCLECANLYHANLENANLSNANLKGTDLVIACLKNADLDNINLENADLSGADLSGAKNIPYIPMVCPDTGAFVGWKACWKTCIGMAIVKLLIPEDAKRSSGTGRKCRCDKAIVLDIEGDDMAYSIHDNNFVYRKGETVTADNFDNDRFVECGSGIHFFINKEEAIEYGKRL